MKSVRKALFVWIGCLLLNTAFAQQHRLRIQIDTAFGLPPSTVTMGDTFNFQVRVYNDSVFAYQGVVLFASRILPDTTTYFAPNSTNGLDYGVTSGDSIPGHGFILRTIKVNVTQPPFKGGPSVVVIWPIAYNPSTFALAAAADTIIFPLNVDTLTAGIGEIMNQRIRISKWGNSLRIEKEGEIQLRRVRIFDILGQQIIDRANPAEDIPLPYLNTGIYLAEVTYNNNQRKVLRVYFRDK